MAQRWMQAKMILAASHGIAVSGAGRAMGFVSEDRDLGKKYSEPKPAPKTRDLETRGLTLVSVTPKLRKPNGTVYVKKSIDKLPRSQRQKILGVKIPR